MFESKESVGFDNVPWSFSISVVTIAIVTIQIKISLWMKWLGLRKYDPFTKSNNYQTKINNSSSHPTRFKIKVANSWPWIVPSGHPASIRCSLFFLMASSFLVLRFLISSLSTVPLPYFLISDFRSRIVFELRFPCLPSWSHEIAYSYRRW